MRAAKLFSALVPQELGGSGLPYSEACALIRGLAHCCGSTALAFSMHQHAVATALWNYRHAKPGEALLRAVADGEKVLVSTGATDWLSSSGVLERCEGGYRFTASKPFASGCVAGDLLVTSGRYDDPVAGRQVLHFSVSMPADGVSIDRVWQAMGMRGTGSHTDRPRQRFRSRTGDYAAAALRRVPPCLECHPHSRTPNVLLRLRWHGRSRCRKGPGRCVGQRRRRSECVW